MLFRSEKQKRINEAKGRAQEIAILANATSKGIEMMAQSIKKPGGGVAVKMQLLESFIEELDKILKHANLSVIPSEMANMKGFFEGMSEVTNNLK